MMMMNENGMISEPESTVKDVLKNEKKVDLEFEKNVDVVNDEDEDDDDDEDDGMYSD